jgi:transposase-like protein
MRQPKEYHYNKWTADETERLRRMVGEGRTHADISRTLGKTVPAVREKCRRERIHSPLFCRRYCRSERVEMAQRYLSGETSTAIAKEYGAHPQTVLNAVDWFIGQEK